MSLSIKPLCGGGFQVEDNTGHWVIFTLHELRSHSYTLRPGMMEGTPELSDDKANLFVWSAFAAARGNAIEHLIPDDPLHDPERHTYPSLKPVPLVAPVSNRGADCSISRC